MTDFEARMAARQEQLNIVRSERIRRWFMLVECTAALVSTGALLLIAWYVLT